MSSQVDAQNRGGAFGQIAINTSFIRNNTVADGDRFFEMYLASPPSGFTALSKTMVVKDDGDDDITLTVDTDTGTDGNQSTLREGAAGSGATVSAAFPDDTTGSVIASATVITLSAAGAASPAAGQAGTGDLTYSPSTPNTITFPATSLTPSGTASLSGLTVTDDDVVEGPETFTVAGSPSVAMGPVTGGQVTIMDNDTDIGLSVDTALVAEGQAVDVVVTAAFAGSSSVLTSATEVSVTAAGAASGGVAGSDFSLSGAGVSNNAFTVSIPAGAVSGSSTVRLTAAADTAAEGAETLVFSGSAAVGGPVDVSPAEVSIADEAESIALTLSAGSAAEGAADAGGVTVTAGYADGSPGAAAVDVTLSFAAGENTEAADFTAPGTAVVLRIPAGSAASSPAALSGLGITGDMIAEGAESVLVKGKAEGFSVEGAVLEITDDDLDVSLTADTDRGTNGDQKTLAEDETVDVRVRAALGPGVTNDLSEDLVVSVSAGVDSPSSAQAGGVDFTAPAPPAPVVIQPGSATASDWTDLTGLTVADDAVAEAAETFRITGTVPGGTVAHDTLTVSASDLSLEVSASPATVVEQAAAHTITVTAGFENASGSELTSATTVNMAVASGGANGATLATSCPTTSEDACTDSTTFNVSIPAGQVSASGTFSLTAREDSNSESTPETLEVTGTVSGDSTNSASATMRIVDQGIRVVFLNQADNTPLSSLGEASGSTVVRVRATKPPIISNRVVVGLNITGGTAVAGAGSSWDEGEDFRVSGLPRPSGTPAGHALGIVIAQTETTATADFTITVNDDNADEANETILITGGDAGTLNIPVIGASLEITDNDTPPTSIDLTLETPDGAPLTGVREDGGTTQVQVKAAYQGNAVLSRALTVPITVGATGTATSGTDYQAVTGVNVVIPAYRSSGSASFNFVIGSAQDDDAAEGPESVAISAGTVSGFAVSPVQFRILDDEFPITLTLLDSATPPQPLASLAEGTAPTAVTVRAAYPGSATRSGYIPVRVSVGGGTTAAGDYQATAFSADPFDIGIAAGINSATESFTLTLNDDRISEGDETLTVTGASDRFVINPAVLTITDNDDPPTGIDLAVSPSTVREDRGTSPLTVTVTARLVGNPRSQPTEVAVRVGGAGTTASSGRDYQGLSPSSFTITIPAGQSSTRGSFRVVILADTADERTERIAVTGTAAALGNAADTAYLNITNVAPPAPPPPPTGGGGGGGGGAPPPSGGGGGGGGGAPPPAGGGAQPPAPPPAPTCVGRFCDDDGNVHQDNIERIANWQITLGCDAQDNTKYCPDAQITRRQMSAFLHRAVSQRWTIQAPEGIELTDVGADEWFRPFAEWVVSVGAFTAPNGVFDPGGVVTRADMAIMMIGAFPHLDAVPTETSRFGDAEGLSPETLAALEGMYQTGVTRGCSAEPLNYCPNQPVTRAQMASFFVRAVNLAPADTQPTPAAQT